MENFIKEILDKYPNCPNPLNYPKSAYFYLSTIMKPLTNKNLMVIADSRNESV